ncbi:MAG: (2Fe-2S)-binding protein [Candidatus Hydrogenedentes bacterium]|nr:(2Fe-2S)-binding protein [Candidatus Hydrogenedentota bacterium]
MPSLTINNKRIEVEPGTTILQAARSLGIEIPTLCHWDSVPPMNSCMLCVVRNAKTGQLLSSCSSQAQQDMEIETDSGDVCAARKEVLDLIVSEHLGDCEAPCSHTCPASMNIPQMMRQMYTGDLEGAAYTVTLGLVFPWTLGYVCPAPCQNPCRRKSYDETMQIRDMHRSVAEAGYSDAPELLECLPDTGKRIAVIGSAMSGMSAAWVLRKSGHACTIFEKEAKAGGKLRGLPEKDLPNGVLDAEIARVERLGVEFRYGSEVTKESLDEIQKEFDAVVVACNGVAPPSGKIFEAKEHKLNVRAVGNGKGAAVLVDRYLKSMNGAAAKELFESKIGRMEKAELEVMRSHNENREAMEPEPVADNLARNQTEAGRCLHCDCRKRTSCRLRKWCSEYGVEMRKFTAAELPEYRIIGRDGDVIFEPGKCIRCGLCVAIAKKYGEEIGLTFIGRGFDMDIRVPFDEPLERGIRESAAECIEACPTAAISWRNAEDAEHCHTTTWIEL